jgi:hypothetical protein
MIIIGRPINGISINGLEWLLTDSGDVMKFINEESAHDFLIEHDVEESELYCYHFEEEE